MARHTRRKYSLRELFAKQNYFVARPLGVPATIYRFFGYREYVNVFFFQYHGYDVYPSTKELELRISGPVTLGDVSRVITDIHIPLTHTLEHASTHGGVVPA